MQATMTTTHHGNTAMEQQAWTLDADAQRAVLDHFRRERVGTYWHNNVVKVIRRARRSGKPCTIRTGGFSTGEFGNILAFLGVKKEERS